jgi:hypothetical protein
MIARVVKGIVKQHHLKFMDKLEQMEIASLGTIIHEGHLYISRHIIWGKGCTVK